MPEDDFMKSMGYPGGGAKAPTSAPGTAAAAIAPETGPRPGHVPTPDELDFQQRAGRGVAKEGAALLTGAGRLMGKGIGLVSPKMQEGLGNLAERVPGVKKMEEFAAEPYQSVAEGVGGTALDIFAPFAAPELGVGRGLSTLASKIAPTAQFAKGAGVVPTRFGRAAGLASTAAEGAAKGAIGGAVANPDDPATGAEIGAAGGIAAPATGGVLSSRTGQYIGGALSRAAPYAALTGAGIHFGGIPGGFAGHAVHHSISSYHSPIGRWLNSFGRRVFDHAGKFIGYIHPMTGGIIAGRASDGSMSNPFGEASSGEGNEGSKAGTE